MSLLDRHHGSLAENLLEAQGPEVHKDQHDAEKESRIADPVHDESLFAGVAGILKFFLHISKEEQKQRLQARLDDPTKHWKFRLDDMKERERWPDYQRAYEDALSRTSTVWAPWYIVPSDRKWYRNLVIGTILVEKLRSLKLEYPPAEENLEGVVIV